MTSYSYLTDDDVPPEYTQPAAQIRRIFSRLITLEREVEHLKRENGALWKRVKGNEAAAPI